MQSTSETIQKAALRGNNVPDSLLALKIVEPSLSQRLMKSLGLLIILLVVTACSALVPVLHLVLFPIMLLVTVVVISVTLQKAQMIESGEGTCPYCQAPFRVFARRFKLPFTDVCESCHRQVTVASR